MNFLRKNPRRAGIIGAMLAILAAGWFFGLPTPALLLVYLVFFLVLIICYRADCAAVWGNILYTRGHMEKAVKPLRYSVTHNTKSPVAHLHYGIYRLRQGEAKEAKGWLDKAEGLNIRPLTLKNVRLTQGCCLWVMGETDAAVAHLERMREMYEYVNPQVLSTLSYLYILKGELAKAESLSNAALEDTPDTASAWDNLGQIWLIRKNRPKAREAFEKALAYKKDLPDSLYYLGVIAQEEGNAAEARRYYTEAAACTITPLNTVTRDQIEAALATLPSSAGTDAP